MFHVHLHDILKPEFFDFVESEAANSVPLEEAKVGIDGVKKEFRRSKITWINNRDLRNELFEIVQSINVKSFGFDIWNIADMQYTIYDGKDEGHYGWHQDDQVSLGPGRVSSRKISLTIQLSDPSEYEGGDFQFYHARELDEEIKEKGTILLFPSSHMHRVTPVTKGIRKSLVAWFEGPHWR